MKKKLVRDMPMVNQRHGGESVYPPGFKVRQLNHLFLSNNAQNRHDLVGELVGSKSEYFEFKTPKSTDIYLGLKGLKNDVDIKIYRKNDFLEGKSPFESSTKPGKKNENNFFTTDPGTDYLIEVVNQGRPSKKILSPYTLYFDTYKPTKNPFLNIPSDPHFSKQWYLFNNNFESANNAKDSVLNFDIKAPEAWTIRTGAMRVPVAVIDTGIDYDHEDLRNNLWTNPGEIPGNNKDDDRNGLKDDIHGWDWGGKHDSPIDSIGHGTHVAGIIGAQGDNGLGISGIAWNAELMNLKIGDLDSINDAIYYAVDNGAKVINMSLGQNVKIDPSDYKNKSISRSLRTHFKQTEQAFKHARDQDVLVVISAGNEAGREGGDLTYWDQAGNHDLFFTGWGSLARDFDNIITVGSIGANQRMAPYSNYGGSVDIAAPGGTQNVSYSIDPVTGSLVPRSELLGIYSTKPMYLHDSIRDAAWFYSDSKQLIDSRLRQSDRLDLVDLNTGDILRTRVSAKKVNISHYQEMIGTSMAAPVVSGSAALIWAQNPDLTAVEVRDLLLEHADQNPLIKPFVNQGRQLNLHQSLVAAIETL